MTTFAARTDLEDASPEQVRAELMRRAASLVPVLRERALSAEKLGHLPEETVDDLREAGLLRVATPQRWGGYPGVDYDLVCEVAFELARGCASTGWCYNNWLVHNWMAGMLSEKGQAAYFAQGPDILTGTASPPLSSSLSITDEGYRISGRWLYSSGSHYSQLFAVANMGLLGGLFVPRSQVTVLDTWRPAGLKGSSTNSITCSDVAVPPELFWTPLEAGLASGAPGYLMHGRPSYRLTMWMFTYAIVAPVVGAAQGAVEVFRAKYAGAAKPGAAVNGGRSGNSEAMQILLAESAAEVDTANLIWRTDLRDTLAQADAGRPFDLEHRARIRRNQAYAAKLAVRAVTRLFEATGGSSLTETDPQQRFFRDVHAALHHITVPWEFTMADYGAVALEQPFVFELQRDGIDPSLIARPPLPAGVPAPPEGKPPAPADLDLATDGPAITLPPQVRAALATAGAEGMPLVISHLDEQGFDKPSYRGSTRVANDSQLALWVRNPAGGLPAQVRSDPAVTVVYRNPTNDSFYRLSGRARLESDPSVCAQVYAGIGIVEQLQDAERKGVAMIIDVTRVAGHDATGSVLVEL